jgi:hypothetical protein
LLIGRGLFTMSARKSSPMMRILLLRFLVLAVCLVLAGC